MSGREMVIERLIGLLFGMLCCGFLVCMVTAAVYGDAWWALGCGLVAQGFGLLFFRWLPGAEDGDDDEE